MQSPKIYKVFVSSTYDDLRVERAEVQKALLKLNCLPVGMEIFPAADDETWDFIKEQIDDSDYYVVLIGGRYGSLSSESVSFTEMEYDYARSTNKPSIAFVHADRSQIPSGKVEKDPSLLKKLDTFIAKVKSRPIRTFESPHQLATEVVASFVDLMSRRPAIGYVRADSTVDYKKYSEVLEKNDNLQKKIEQLGEDQKLIPFMGYDQEISLSLVVDVTGAAKEDDSHEGQPKVQPFNVETNSRLGKLLLDMASDLILAKDEDTILANLARVQFRRNRNDAWLELQKQGISPNHDDIKIIDIRLSRSTCSLIRRRLYALNLIEVSIEKRKVPDFSIVFRTIGTPPEVDKDFAVWKFTQLGRHQLLILEGLRL